MSNQAKWIERAQAVLPAGGFGNFDPGIIIERGQGSRVWDEDGSLVRGLHFLPAMQQVFNSLKTFARQCPVQSRFGT